MRRTDAARHDDPDTLPIRGHWQRGMLQLSHQRAVFARLANGASLFSEARAPSWRPPRGEAWAATASLFSEAMVYC